jgi:hypothetical protein
MIPIINITGLAALFCLFFLIIRLYSSYGRTKNIMIGYFLKAFLSFTAAMFIVITNGIIFKDLRIIGLIFNIYPFFYFLGLGYFTMITFQIIGQPLIKKISFIILFIYGLAVSTIPAFEFKPAIMTVQPPFIFWEDARGPLINNLVGVGVAIPILWFIFFFLFNGIKNKEPYVRKRSFLLSAGMTCFLVAGITDFIFGFNPDIFYVSLYTAFWGILAAGFFILAVQYKKDQISFGEKAE